MDTCPPLNVYNGLKVSNGLNFANGLNLSNGLNVSTGMKYYQLPVLRRLRRASCVARSKSR